jgi:hypothetical protein
MKETGPPWRMDKSVFQIWNENDRKLPFYVQKNHWSKESYFMVTKVEVSTTGWDRFNKTGDLYGRAFGFFARGREPTMKGNPIELQNAGVYKWRRVEDEELQAKKKTSNTP